MIAAYFRFGQLRETQGYQVKGILHGWFEDFLNRPCTSIKRFPQAQIPKGTTFTIATKMYLFHRLRQTAMTAIF